MTANKAGKEQTPTKMTENRKIKVESGKMVFPNHLSNLVENFLLNCVTLVDTVTWLTTVHRI